MDPLLDAPAPPVLFAGKSAIWLCTPSYFPAVTVEELCDDGTVLARSTQTGRITHIHPDQLIY